MSQIQVAASDTLDAVKCDLAGDILCSSGKLRLRANGWSMLPTIMPGNLLLVERAGHGVSTGDIVVFSRDGRLFVHRVVSMARKSGDAFVITQGDGMAQPDPPVAASELLGKVALIERSGWCIAPRKSLSVSGRALAAMVRRFDTAARILVGVHGVWRNVKESAFPCQS
jgi:signal peptidase I